MKVTINGKVSKEVLKTILNDQKEKTKIIDEYCRTNKLLNFKYSDSELEYEYKITPKVKEVEKR